jgi:hypothetical protein
MLARMGVPLQQCRQSYQYMAPALRSHFTQQIGDEAILEAYNFTNPGVTFKVSCCAFSCYRSGNKAVHVGYIEFPCIMHTVLFLVFIIRLSSLLLLHCSLTLCFIILQSFYRYNSFKNPIAASDIVHAATALIEMYGAAAYSSGLTHTGASPTTVTGLDGTVSGADGSAAVGADGSVTTAVVAAGAAMSQKVNSTEAFYEAYSCLGMRADEVMQKGIQAALDLQRVSARCLSHCMYARTVGYTKLLCVLRPYVTISSNISFCA